MKKTLLAGLATGLFLLGMGGVAQALTMTDVGTVDTLIASGTVNSGDSNELDWVNKSVFGDDYKTSGVAYFTTMTKKDKDDWAGWIAVDDSNPATRIYDYDFTSVQPAYFFIKTATSNNPGADTGVDHYLFMNISNLDYGVIDLNMGNLVDIYNIGKLSHIGEVGTTPVPEPATMLLFGAGLVGLAGIARRKVQ